MLGLGLDSTCSGLEVILAISYPASSMYEFHNQLAIKNEPVLCK